MSIKASKKERIKKYILETIDNEDVSVAKKVADNFEISQTTVYRYIRELYEDGLIDKDGKNYTLKKLFDIKRYRTSDDLEEDRIFDEVIYEKVKSLPINVYKIWQYTFTEMMNNAIDHANASSITVAVMCDKLSTCIEIIDDGIGIFNKIKEYYGYKDLDNAVEELFKGKLTTDSANHSGEGIFFTSKMLDNFGVLSSGKIFSHNTISDIIRDVEAAEGLEQWKDNGTVVVMKLANDCKINMKEVFDMFSDVESGVVKTKIPLKSIFTDGFPVSRSQAKRLYARFDEFNEIVLDFEGIDDIGQGFAHELFVVFKNKYPQIEFIVENENEEVRKMINHVTAKKQ